MRALVTGGAGFIGSHIVDNLIGRGADVLVVDDMSTGKRENVNPRARLVEMDIGDPGMTGVFEEFRPDVISHCAAQIVVPVSMVDPMLDARTNILGGINVLQAAVRAGCRQLVYITTGGALYGPPDYLPCDEEHPIQPISGYGLSKWTLERYLQMLAPASMGLKVLRLANVFGPRQDPNGEAGVVSIFALRMLRGDPVTIFGDGEQTRDFVYVGDAARAHELAEQAAESVTVNISSGQATSVNELFSVMAAEVGYDRSPDLAMERPGDIKHVVLANDRAKRQLGWEPKTSFEAGMRETLAWMRSEA